VNSLAHSAPSQVSTETVNSTRGWSDRPGCPRNLSEELAHYGVGSCPARGDPEA